MAGFEENVARHYGIASLKEAILGAIEKLRPPGETLTPAHLAGLDEFHMGGHPATEELGARLDLAPGLGLIDIGCGVGGPARYFALQHGCEVTGIDLTPEYVEVAEMLTEMMGLGQRVRFQRASATALPFPEKSFARATLLHVGMNIPDKAALCREAARVLEPGGLFGVYDVMQTGAGALEFPVAWAESADTSALAGPEAYRAALEAAGFRIESETDKRKLGLEFFQRVQAKLRESGGRHPFMGATAPQKIANLIKALESGTIAPIEMICRKPSVQ